MHILALGLDHRTDVLVRERLSIPTDSLAAAHALLRERFAEGVVLSTCNRTEVYALVAEWRAGRGGAERLLADVCGVPVGEFAGVLAEYRGDDAVRHLFRVASGLESMIVGEHEILGQLRSALDEARQAGSAGPVVTRLLRDALAVGKRARVESGIARSAVSVGTAAVELAQRAAGGLEERTALVIGSGKMGAAAARALMSKRVGRLLVASRHRARAEALARRLHAEPLVLSELPDAIADSDIVISATAAAEVVVSAAAVRRAVARRRERPLVLIDIAVPRDIDPAVAQVRGCRLFNIDDLVAVREANLAARRLEGQKVEAMIERQVDRFSAWYAARDVAPTIADLVAHAEQIRSAELDRALARLGALSERERNLVNAMTTAIVSKMLHRPIVRLKARGGRHDASVYVHAVRELFGLAERE